MLRKGDIMKKFKKIPFNLIEIVLAITILVVGTVSVIALLPVGLSENRKAIVQNNAAHSAESMFAYISNHISHSNNNWSSFVDNFPVGKPDSKLTGEENLTALSGNIYDYENVNGVYAVKLKTGTHNDMTGEVLVWTSEVQKTYFAGNLITDAEGNTGLGSDSIIGINIELSFPVEKPYDKRDKFKYYFEAFNKNTLEIDEEDDGQLFEEGDGIVTVNFKSILSVEVLGTFFAYSNGEKAKVFLQLEVVDPDGTVTISSPFNNGSYLSYLDEDIVITPTVYTQNVAAGTKFRISARGKCVHSGANYGPYWSDNTMQADALLDGQVPYPYTPAGSQPPFNTFITDYLSEDTGEVTIEDYEILFLFELNSVPKSHSSYDMQDLVVLAGIERVAITPEEAAAQEAVDAAEVALSSAQTALNTAEASKASKLSAVNSIKNSVNYSSKLSKRNKKYTAWQNAVNKYNSNPTSKRLRRKNIRESKYQNAQANLDNAISSITVKQTEYDDAVTVYNTILAGYNNAQTVYDSALDAYNNY